MAPIHLRVRTLAGAEREVKIEDDVPLALSLEPLSTEFDVLNESWYAVVVSAVPPRKIEDCHASPRVLGLADGGTCVCRVRCEEAPPEEILGIVRSAT